MVEWHCSFATPPDTFNQNIFHIEAFKFQSTDPILKSDTSSCMIPFTRVGNLIVVQASVNSIFGNFILDTGSPHLVLNTTYFRDYPLLFTKDEEQTTITGRAGIVERTMVKHFTLGTLHYYRAEADWRFYLLFSLQITNFLK